MQPNLPKSREALEELVRNLEAQALYRKFHKLEFYKPYPKQLDWHMLGAAKHERALFAGNQEGKTVAGGAETAMHLTGIYPDWWKGYRFTKPIRAWVCGEEGVLLRDGPQSQLCGPAGVDEAFGSGYIQRDLFVGKPSMARGVTDLYDTIQVRHSSGGVSTATFKTYGQGRAKHQTEKVDWIWDDEEPPPDIYSEHQARTAASEGCIACTFTPLQGMSDVVLMYLRDENENRGFVRMGLKDALHFTPEARERLLLQYPPHERDARLEGIPMQGEGRVWQFPVEQISEPPIPLSDVPLEWRKLWGLDFGINHPFAAVLIAWDLDTDIIHVLHALRIVGQTKMVHVPAIRSIAPSVPVSWPHDGARRDTGSGDQLAEQYRNPMPGMQGLSMLASPSAFPNGSMSTMAGIDEMSDRMQTGRFKVNANLTDWFEEYGLYHYQDGLLVKIRDDLLSATRIAIMSKRFARAVPTGNPQGHRKRLTNLELPQCDPWTGMPIR